LPVRCWRTRAPPSGIEERAAGGFSSPPADLSSMVPFLGHACLVIHPPLTTFVRDIDHTLRTIGATGEPCEGVVDFSFLYAP
jgi:hypothetical protein